MPTPTDPPCDCGKDLSRQYRRDNLSFTSEDFKIASSDRLLFSYKFSNAVLPQASLAAKTVGFMAQMLRLQAVPELTPQEFRASIVKAEAELLRGTLLLLQESLASFIKTGLALHRGYNIYAAL